MFKPAQYFGRWLVIAVAVGLLCCAVAFAGKPAKPPGSNGGGVIYFSWNGKLYTMNDEGSDVTLVAGFPYGYGAWGDPSRQKHAAKRWFVQTKDVLGEFYPDFRPDGTPKFGADRRVFVALSDAGDAVELAIAPDLEPLEQPKWVIGDGLLSWVGRRWNIDSAQPDYGVVLEGGLYVTGLTFDDDGNVAAAGPSALLVPFPLVPSNVWRDYSVFSPGPDLYSHDFDPTATQFVFNAVSTDEVRVGDVASGRSWAIFSEPGADGIGSARWSPAGDTIMFTYDPDIGHPRVMLTTPDGSHMKMLVRSSPEWTVYHGVWSPTGSHLLYQYYDHWEADSHIVRATANGSGKTRITDKSMGTGMQPPKAIGWR